MKKLIMCLMTSLLATSAFADGGTGGCTGIHQGKKIILNGLMSSRNLDNATASVVIDGRTVAHFDGADLKLNILFRSFKIRNDRGDYAEGKLTNIAQKSGVLTRLSVPAYGIEYRNVQMSCWTKK